MPDEEWEEVEDDKEKDDEDNPDEDHGEFYDSGRDWDDEGFCPECDAHIEGGDEHEEDCPYYDDEDD